MEAPQGEPVAQFSSGNALENVSWLLLASSNGGGTRAAHNAGIVHGPSILLAFSSMPGVWSNSRFRFHSACATSGRREGAAYCLRRLRALRFTEQVQAPSLTSGRIYSRSAPCSITDHWPPGLPWPDGFRYLEKRSWVGAKSIWRAKQPAPRGMGKLIKRCLRKDPQLRFSSFGEIQPLLAKMMDAHNRNSTANLGFSRETARRTQGSRNCLVATAVWPRPPSGCAADRCGPRNWKAASPNHQERRLRYRAGLFKGGVN